MLGLLKEKQVYAKYSKGKFLLLSVSILGHMVSKEGVIINFLKVEAIKNWSIQYMLQRFIVLWGWLITIVNLSSVCLYFLHMTHLT